MNQPVYLDHNATTPVAPEVFEAMAPFLTHHFGNPSSGHAYGRRAREAIEEARARVAALIGARPEEIVFTGCGTESDNLAVRGVARMSERPGQVVISAVEHPAVEAPCRLLEGRGWRVARAPVDQYGRVDAERAAAMLTPETRLVSVMHANNETGTLQPVAEIAEAARRVGAVVHSDAAQSVGKVPVNVEAMGVDLLTVAGHKLYAPKGIGALYVRRGTPIAPLLVGGGQEGGLRPGTENVASIVALGAAAALAAQDLAGTAACLRQLRDRLFALLGGGIPGAVLNGHPDQRLPNTLSLRFPGVRGSAVLAAAPEVAASTGSACHEGGERPSPVLTAMGLRDEEALGTVRLSLGRGTTAEDVERAAAALVRAWRTCSA